MIDHGSFKINMDEDVPDTQIKDDIENTRFEKLSTRMTLITIIITCLVAVLLAFVYMDVRKKVNEVQDSGTSTVQSLSKDLEARLAEIYKEQTGLKESIPEKFASFEKTTTYLGKELNTSKKNIDKSIKNIRRIYKWMT